MAMPPARQAAMEAGAPAWLVPDGTGGWMLSVWVQPGARGTGPQGILDGCLKLRLAAPPVDGKANDALLRWVAERAGVPARSVELASGHASRRKRVRLACALPREALEGRLLAER